MLTMKRPKEGVFNEREEGRINSFKDKCTRRVSHSRLGAFLCRTWIGSGSDYTLETMEGF